MGAEGLLAGGPIVLIPVCTDPDSQSVSLGCSSTLLLFKLQGDGLFITFES